MMECVSYEPNEEVAKLAQMEDEHWDMELEAAIAISKTSKGTLEGLKEQLEDLIFAVKARELRDKVLQWWEEHQSDTYSTGDDDWDNVYDEEPDFVTLAKQLKKGVEL